MKVSNPLTIISIFAGIAESFATVALIKLPIELQLYFVNFVIFFPIAIVTTFFAILIFKPQVLYAPSDYEDQEHFLLANRLRNKIAEEAEKALANIPNKEAPKNDSYWKELSARIADSTINELTSENEKLVFDYLTKHSNEAFSERGLKFIIPIGKSSINLALYSLESKGLVNKGVDGNVVIWQIKT
ncbi:hypothetical protein EKO29_14210 [Colwellia sp. Arc7-635]|uniref:hypothetical protein n=1 Tax=Colwellia sp. Arc7-635 TaxID=2497879 RepID=UPI000F851C80|nr:hypothetical protein [Colwellia sp. Arc7-635]AZQ85031.1 hypothetical protein EKO29_14210 [Colwellia sp. Arc7-635]